MLARELMTTPVITIHQTATLSEAAALLVERKINGLIIVDDEDALAGILTSTDFAPHEVDVPYADMRATQLFRKWLGPGGVEKAYHDAESTQLKDVMNRTPITSTEDVPIETIARLMIEHNINHVPILRGTTIVGIITRHDLLRLLTRRPSA